jgi:Lar family restriction alleviation protein
LRDDWEYIKDEVMEKLLKEKFSTPCLKQKLIETKGNKLVEGNVWHDNYWGDCKCHKCKNKKGLNKLGKILMKIRHELLFKPCPFCGSKAELKSKTLPPQHDSLRIWAQCSKCLARGPCTTIDDCFRKEGNQEAMQLWNDRE